MLSISGYSKQFGDKQVLKDVTFRLISKQIIGIWGNNGSGKSTMLKAILGFTDSSKKLQ